MNGESPFAPTPEEIADELRLDRFKKDPLGYIDERIRELVAEHAESAEVEVMEGGEE